MPYLNPAAQGLDKLARQIYKKPLQTLVKGGISITAPTLLLQYMNKENPYYNQLDNRTKDPYYLIPNPSDKDTNGSGQNGGFIIFGSGILCNSTDPGSARLARRRNIYGYR